MSSAQNRQTASPLAMPPRPAHRLSDFQLLRVALGNSLAAFDQQMFDDLIVERRFLWYRSFTVSDPAGIRRVMLDNLANYPRIPQMQQILEPALGEGLLSAEGEVWRRHRQLLAPTLDHQSVLADAPIVIQTAMEVADTIAALPAGAPIDINQVTTTILVRTIARIFGDERIEPLLVAFLESPRSRRLTDFVQAPAWVHRLYGRDPFRDTAGTFRPLLLSLIAERRRPDYQGRRDLLWRLGAACNRITGEQLSDTEVCNEALTLAFGGVDTTMRAISWIWYLLAAHPDAEAKVHAELDAVLNARAPDAADVPSLPYLRKVIDETLRLYPAIPAMLRIAAGDDVLCGRDVRRGTLVLIAPWVVHRHSKLWTDPDRFDPERFSPENNTARPRYAYIPFALGPHICIGASLAMMEMMLITAVLAQRFRFRLMPDRPVRPVGGFFTLRAAGGLWMTAEARGAP